MTAMQRTACVLAVILLSSANFALGQQLGVSRPRAAQILFPAVASPGSRSAGPDSNSSSATAGTAGSTLPLRSCSDIKKLPNGGSDLENFFCAKVAQIASAKSDPTSALAGLDLRRDFFFFMIALLAREGRAQYVLAAENERTDKQVGANPSGSGTNSLVSKGSVPAVLGFAVDNGAITKSTSGTTLTFRGNLTGLAKALADKGFISGFDDDSGAARFFRRASFSLSYDPSRGQEPGVFTGKGDQLSNVSFRLDLYNQRDSRLARYKADWDVFISTRSNALVAQIDASQRTLTNIADRTTSPIAWRDPSLQAWFVVADNAVRNATADSVEAVFRDQLNRVPTNLSPAVVGEINSFDTRFKEWRDAREGILDKISKAWVATFEYSDDRPLNAPDLSRFKLIVEKGLSRGYDLTFNGSVAIFNKTPTAAQGGDRLHDVSLALQFDIQFGELGLGMGKPVLSFAGSYKHQTANDTSSAGVVIPDTKGDIGVGQIKLEIPIKNSGIKIPFSVSYANRTDLIKEKEIRGHFGFTFDPDALFAKFKAFTQK